MPISPTATRSCPRGRASATATGRSSSPASPTRRADLAGLKVAIPGELTTAHLALRLWQPQVTVEIVPFDRILDVVLAGEADAGVVIHEGQLTYGDLGLRKVVDLGEWWKGETGLPLPLGGNGIRRDIEPELKRRLCRLLTESIELRARPPAGGAGLCHRATPAASRTTPSARTVSSACTSTTGPATTARPAAAPCSSCSTAGTRRASCRAASRPSSSEP